jgi:hypothetical protein
MNKINLSSIPEWYNMTAQEATEYLISQGADTVVNNYGKARVEYYLFDIPYVWEHLKLICKYYLAVNN